MEKLISYIESKDINIAREVFWNARYDLLVLETPSGYLENFIVIDAWVCERQLRDLKDSTAK